MMMNMYFSRILKNSIKKGFCSVMVKKLIKRLEKNTSAEALAWIKDVVTCSTAEYCERIDSKLWTECKKECEAITKDARAILSGIPFDLGGGGNFPLIYFLTRKYKPAVVVETGVAAGWSSISILRAFKKNKAGQLYSSDFPYIRLENPEQYIGIVTKNEPNKDSWDLDMRGDDTALPAIMEKLGEKKIDFFHYDSDKSYSGRTSAYDIVQSNLSSQGIVIFDDIQDNSHFRDFVTKSGIDFVVLEFEGKYVGLIHNS